MRKLVLLFLLPAACLLPPAISAQDTTRSGPTLPASCVPARNNVFYRVGFGWHRCTARNVWTPIPRSAIVPGITLEDAANKSTNTNLGTSDFLYPTQNAVKSYADSLVVGLLNDRGSFDASSNVFPSSGGSGTAGAIRKGDLWYISVAGTLGGTPVSVGYSVRALADSPGQTAGNWGILNVGLGYVPENSANRRTSFQVTPDDSHYASEKLVKDSLDLKVPTSRTVNGHALSSNVTVTPGDLSLVIGTDVQAFDSDLVAIAGLSASNDDVIQRKSGAWTNRTPAQLKTDLALVKSDVGLGNVDNTSDASKPISTLQQAALDLKAPLADPSFTGRTTIGTGTFTGNGLPAGFSTPLSLAIVNGTSASPNTSSFPAVSISDIRNAPYVGGLGSLTLHVTQGAGVDRDGLVGLALWIRQSGAFSNGGMVGAYLHSVAEIQGTADSHFSLATSHQKYTHSDGTGAELDVDNEYNRAITSVTNTSPMTVATGVAHNLTTGWEVDINGVVGTTAANGLRRTVTVTGPTTFTIPLAGNGAYVSGGTVVLPSDLDYGTAGNRSQGLIIASIGRAKHTAGFVLDTQNGATSNVYTGIDLRPNSVDSTTARAIRIPNATDLVSWVAAGGNNFALITGSSGDKVWLDRNGKTVQAGTGPTVVTNAAGALLATALTGTLPAAQFPALTGDVTTSAGSLATTISNSAVTSAKLNITTTSCTNQFVSAISAGGVGTCTTPNLATSVTGTLAVANGGTGDTGTAWTPFTPTVTAGTGTFTTVSGALRYKLLGKTCFFTGSVTVTSNGTAATSVLISLPVTASASGGSQRVVGALNGADLALTGYIGAGSSSVTVVRYDGTYPNGSFQISGVIETN